MANNHVIEKVATSMRDKHIKAVRNNVVFTLDLEHKGNGTDLIQALRYFNQLLTIEGQKEAADYLQGAINVLIDEV